MAVRRGDTMPKGPMSKISFLPGDVLILQTRDESLLLKQPPSGFYSKQYHISKGNGFMALFFAFSFTKSDSSTKLIVIATSSLRVSGAL